MEHVEHRACGRGVSEQLVSQMESFVAFYFIKRSKLESRLGTEFEQSVKAPRFDDHRA